MDFIEFEAQYDSDNTWISVLACQWGISVISSIWKQVQIPYYFLPKYFTYLFYEWHFLYHIINTPQKINSNSVISNIYSVFKFLQLSLKKCFIVFVLLLSSRFQSRFMWLICLLSRTICLLVCFFVFFMTLTYLKNLDNCRIFYISQFICLFLCDYIQDKQF